MADYELTVQNDDRACWVDPNGAGAGIEVDVDAGGGAGSVTIRARLVFPQLAGIHLQDIVKYMNLWILPVTDSGLNVDWSVADFTIDVHGYLTFTLYNHTSGQAEEVGEFYVVVERVKI